MRGRSRRATSSSALAVFRRTEAFMPTGIYRSCDRNCPIAKIYADVKTAKEV
jgi:hypothetical protein